MADWKPQAQEAKPIKKYIKNIKRTREDSTNLDPGFITDRGVWKKESQDQTHLETRRRLKEVYIRHKGSLALSWLITGLSVEESGGMVGGRGQLPTISRPVLCDILKPASRSELDGGSLVGGVPHRAGRVSSNTHTSVSVKFTKSSQE